MNRNRNSSGNGWLGIFIFLGLVGLGYQLATAAIKHKERERTVLVKGLSEREYPADLVIWPIQFTVADNDLEALYDRLERQAGDIQQFLAAAGVAPENINLSIPAITDKSAQQWNNQTAAFRYSAVQTVTVHSDQVERVRQSMNGLSQLGRSGIVFSGDGYGSQTQYLFTQLNEIKPEMVEEATRKARQVAEKFAADSQSTLGKIKRASQGQFSINPRDNNNPQIKTIRVVSTIEYYLSD